MSVFTDCIRNEKEYPNLLAAVEKEFASKNTLPLLVTGLCDGASDSMLISLASDLQKKHGCFLVFCSEEKECVRISELFRSHGKKAAAFLPRDFNFYNISASHDYEHERLAVLSGISSGAFEIITTTPDAALAYTIPPERLESATIRLDYSYQSEISDLCSKLVDAGYQKVELVENAGQFASRGGIIDIFSPYGNYTSFKNENLSGSYPLRIEFFGNEIDRMGIFDPATQRVISNVRFAELPPSREVMPTRDDLESIKRSIRNLIKNVEDDKAKEELVGEERSVNAALSGLGEIAFADKYILKIYPEKATLLDYFSSRSVVIVKNTGDVSERLKASRWHSDNTVKELTESGTIAPKYAEYVKESSCFEAFLERNVTVHADSIVRGLAGKKLGGMFSFKTRHTVAYAGNNALLLEDLENYVSGAWKTVIEVESDTAAENLCGYLNDCGFSAAISSNDSHELPERKKILICSGGSVRGYELSVSRIAVLSMMKDENSLSAARRKSKKTSKKKSSNSILSYAELTVGDYVVHENYGIGQYEGIENLTVNGVSRDYINIKFAGPDRLFLPTDKLDLISKYIGARSDDGYVKLSRFGGAEWGKAKARAKSAVKEIAKDLIKLYAERMRRPGYAFPRDDDFQRDFEAAFEYEETESQLNVTDEIKADMERSVPMDRLLCGDVGFGKTEVALRAAYKAVLGGKQVAILVPTTILALQHYQTAISRMRSFPVNIDMISRFRTPKQQSATVRALKRGDTDIIIGTHRLLSKDMEYKDLGLLIVDEEQRFGVAQKEKLKQLAGNIDVLTLTATPIPRTLNMAMSGIRDISVLDEAPGDRLPVQTYVLEDDDLIIFEAIRRELRRGGQVFYLHNFIESIDALASKLLGAFPDARITTAHGKMDKERLEDIWKNMLNGEIDILICTSIIETGIDVPNANTLIVDNAHRLGLSQLHQIRGRVGRSSRRAYAYFTFPKDRAISEIAEKRLEALREYAEFGAGFRIALRDLELRGAGNLLGAEQHGHLDAIGYELYIKLLHEAVLEEQGSPAKQKLDCTISIDVDAYIPEKYIKFPPQRMALYKRIATVETEEDADDILDELTDRYGDAPVQIKNLLKIALIKAKATACKFKKVTQNGNDICITPLKVNIDAWQELTDTTNAQIRIVMSAEPYLSYKLSSKADKLDDINKLFEKYLEISQSNGRQDA